MHDVDHPSLESAASLVLDLVARAPVWRATPLPSASPPSHAPGAFSYVDRAALVARALSPTSFPVRSFQQATAPIEPGSSAILAPLADLR